jgi:hypothetical protein
MVENRRQQRGLTGKTNDVVEHNISGDMQGNSAPQGAGEEESIGEEGTTEQRSADHFERGRSREARQMKQTEKERRGDGVSGSKGCLRDLCGPT